MKHLFSPEGSTALAATLARRPLLAFDFDGTLAPIVTVPESARMPPSVTRRLELLARRLPVAIITGRSVADVRQRLDFEPHYIIGNHGAEEAGMPEPQRAEIGVAFDGLRERLNALAADFANAGVTVEDKRHSIALHYRRAYDPERALALILRLVPGLDPHLTASVGKMVVNVVAADAPNKAQALAGLVRRSGAQAVLFVGDDVNDEPVFAYGDPNWLTVRVQCGPPPSQAMFCLNHAGEVPRMLERMLRLLGDG
jgi:trehalose 6-phosphate phosphatase